MFDGTATSSPPHFPDRYVFAACGTTSEHDAATKLQATFRGHHDRRKVESIKASNKEVEALKAAAEEGAAVRAEMDAAAARLQAVARGRKARAGVSRLGGGCICVHGSGCVGSPSPRTASTLALAHP